MIIVDNLSKSYGGKKVLSDLSFTVPDGQITGFLGPNGSGKSTTMRCMLGLDRPDAGSVTFTSPHPDGRTRHGGLDYSGAYADLDAKSQVAGAVLDAGWFHTGRSGRAHLRALAAAAGYSSARADECLEMVGLTPAAKKKIGSYSLGMKQRLGLAAALLGEPDHLLLDEPVNGLDPEGVRWVRRVLRAQADRGCAILVSSHLLSEMEATADRLVVIGTGTTIGEYSLDDFLADGTTILIDTPDAAGLHRSLADAGIAATSDGPRSLRVTVSTGEGGGAGADSGAGAGADSGAGAGTAAGAGAGTAAAGAAADAACEELRTRIATIALEQRHLITGMRVERVNLESRFLEATTATQEYRTQ